MSQKSTSFPAILRDNVIIDGLIGAPTSGAFVQKVIESGVTAANWTVAEAYDDLTSTLNSLNLFYFLEEQFPDKVILVHKADDILRAKIENKLGIILGFQTGHMIGTKVHLLRIFHRLGIRIIGLAYNDRNALAAGCIEPVDSGLSSLGVQAVQEMNRLGIIVDLSHVGRRSSLDAIDISEKPVIFSHSNAAAVQSNPRNITDEQIKKCAAKGGVIGLAVFSAFVGDTSGGRHPTLKEYFKHIDYLLDLVGPDHVAMGSDIFLDATEGVVWRAGTGRLYPTVSTGMTYETHNIAGFKDFDDYPAVVQAMLDYGYSEEVVRKFLGENWLRVFREVWK